ncbi:hypothetical protein V6N11_018890 [Hibiscus sabdariffa]|uniref:CRIB domain-containing protein n=1 Tax=Hibiscus sabdariffa TaxID=183260 RepID=A0ABR2R0Q0_9ROSI
MRDKMERLVILPFSVGCVSDASVAVAVQRHHHQPRRSKPADTSLKKRTQEEDEEGLSSENIKYSLKLLPLPKPDISTGLNRLFTKTSVTCPNIYSSFRFPAYKEEIDEPENEMEIGFPTDVKHVTHIGLDGSACSSPRPSRGSWDHPLSLHDLFTFPITAPSDTHPATAST